MYDKDRSGTISFEEFQGLVRYSQAPLLHVQWLQPVCRMHMCAQHCAPLTLVDVLQHQFLMDMHASFHHFDTDRSGTCLLYTSDAADE